MQSSHVCTYAQSKKHNLISAVKSWWRAELTFSARIGWTINRCVETSLIYKKKKEKQVPWIKLKCGGKDPHQKRQQNAMKKKYPLQKLIHALKNCGPRVQKQKSCTAINFVWNNSSSGGSQSHGRIYALIQACFTLTLHPYPTFSYFISPA